MANNDRYVDQPFGFIDNFTSVRDLRDRYWHKYTRGIGLIWQQTAAVIFLGMLFALLAQLFFGGWSGLVVLLMSILVLPQLIILSEDFATNNKRLETWIYHNIVLRPLQRKTIKNSARSAPNAITTVTGRIEFQAASERS
jgi:hypothetical protein